MTQRNNPTTTTPAASMEAARISNASSTNASDMETRSNSNWSGPLGKRSTGKKSARFSDDAGSSSSSIGIGVGGGSDDSEYVEVIVNVTQQGIEIENPELSLLGKTLEHRPSFVRSASAKLRQFSHELKASLSLSRKGAASAAESALNLDRSKTAARRALKGLKLLSKTTCAHDWATVSQKFDSLAVDAALPRQLFAQCIGMKESIEFAGELFDGLARRRGITVGVITKEELKEFWEQIHDQSFDARLQTFFDMVDKDADGRITEAEIKEVIAISASANKLSKVKDQAEEYSALIMEELDPNDLGYIEIENLQMLLLEGPGQSVRHAATASRNLSQMISQKLVSKKAGVIERWFEKTKFFLEDNWQRVWVLLLWLAILAGLFTWKFIQYKRRSVFHVMGYCVCAAKGAAETLKFNMALILLPVCRNTITWLRNKTKMGVAVPFDDNLNFHKVIAAAVAIGVGIHALSHLTCDFPRLLHASEQDYIPLRTFFGHNKPPNYWWFVKGFEGISGIIMIVLMAIAFTLAMPWFRRNRLADKLPKPLKKLTGFNAFWYSHHLFVIVYILLILHGIFLYLSHKWYKKTTWMYLAVPVCLYAGERVLRAFRSGYKSVNLIKVAIYPGNVMSIRMSKPPGFNYRSGQYMFVNCPAVSPFEWHPFSITSAPGDDYLSVHIRTLGDWTRSLKDVFAEVCEPSTGDKSGLLRADCLQGEYIPGFPKLSIDGPYGAPAQDYRQYDVLLLVGLGIGATPMISIVKDIINNMKLKQEENDMEAANAAAKRNNNRSKSFNTTRAYFYWVTREQGSFEWFREVMNEVAVIDKEGVIELHNYCTSVYEEGDARSALIAMLQALHLAKHGVDVVSGTKVKTHFAKPKWRDVFKRIAVNHKDAKIGVFYCGAPGLTGELRQLASDFTHRTGTRFDFHKENF